MTMISYKWQVPGHWNFFFSKLFLYPPKRVRAMILANPLHSNSIILLLTPWKLTSPKHVLSIFLSFRPNFFYSGSPWLYIRYRCLIFFILITGSLRILKIKERKSTSQITIRTKETNSSAWEIDSIILSALSIM